MSKFKVSEPISTMTGAFSVSGLNVVVTGGNRGIGRGIAQAFAESGANVAILCRNAEKGQQAAGELMELGGNHFCVACDVSSLDSVKAAYAQVIDKFDHVDVLVNNAGISTVTPFLQDEDLAEWHRVIDTDLHGVANMVYTYAPGMIERGEGGTIINISSAGGRRTPIDSEMTPYHVAKAGVDIFSRFMQVKLGGENIRVHSVCPGPIHSDLDEGLPASAIDNFYNKMPAHRFGEALEVGAACVYLASPAGAFVRGENFLIDGGLTCIE